MHWVAKSFKAVCRCGLNAPSLSTRNSVTAKIKLYVLLAPEVERIGKGQARKPYEFGVKSAVVVSHQHGLLLGRRCKG